MPLICELCDKQFKSQGGYDYHAKNVCVQKVDGDDVKREFLERVKRVCDGYQGEGDGEGSVPLICKSCNKRFKSQGGYDYHIGNVCRDGKRGSSSKETAVCKPKNLVKGEIDDAEEEGEGKEGEDEEWRNSSSPRKRKRKETSGDGGEDAEERKENVKFICDVCNKNFKSEGGHRYHMANVCNSKVGEEAKEGNVKFNCDVCRKQFKSEGGYRYHVAKNVCNNRRERKEGDEEGAEEDEVEGGEGNIKLISYEGDKLLAQEPINHEEEKENGELVCNV